MAHFGHRRNVVLVKTKRYTNEGNLYGSLRQSQESVAVILFVAIYFLVIAVYYFPFFSMHCMVNFRFQFCIEIRYLKDLFAIFILKLCNLWIYILFYYTFLSKYNVYLLHNEYIEEHYICKDVHENLSQFAKLIHALDNHEYGDLILMTRLMKQH